VILLDTSGILAALFADQRHHEECAKVLREAQGPLILSPFVLAESVRVIRRRAGSEAVRMLLEDVDRGAYELAAFDETATGELVARHEMGLATASLFVLAERYECRKVLSLRRDCFPKRFKVLPL
jgi:uncharacterized protein